MDWAEQQEEPSEEEMNKVKSCYVRNLKEAYTEEMIKERSHFHSLLIQIVTIFSFYSAIIILYL